MARNRMSKRRAGRHQILLAMLMRRLFSRRYHHRPPYNGWHGTMLHLHGPKREKNDIDFSPMLLLPPNQKPLFLLLSKLTLRYL